MTKESPTEIIDRCAQALAYELLRMAAPDDCLSAPADMDMAENWESMPDDSRQAVRRMVCVVIAKIPTRSICPPPSKK